jgi:hypothetical protein
MLAKPEEQLAIVSDVHLKNCPRVCVIFLEVPVIGEAITVKGFVARVSISLT